MPKLNIIGSIPAENPNAAPRIHSIEYGKIFCNSFIFLMFTRLSLFKFEMALKYLKYKTRKKPIIIKIEASNFANCAGKTMT